MARPSTDNQPDLGIRSKRLICESVINLQHCRKILLRFKSSHKQQNSFSKVPSKVLSCFFLSKRLGPCIADRLPAITHRPVLVKYSLPAFPTPRSSGPGGCQSKHLYRFGNGGRVRGANRNMLLVCIAAKGTAHVACVCACACTHACVRAHFCACVRACLRVCVRVYAHLNMRTKFTKHSGQRARIYVQLIACKCAGPKGCGFIPCSA